MAAQPRTIPLKTGEDASHLQAHVGDRQVIRHDFDDRRRMNVSEKLAEGRGFWRGAFVGLSIGAAGGIIASAGIANMWTPQVLQTVQNSAVIAQTLAGVDAGHAVQTVHPETSAAAQSQIASGPAGGAGK